MEDILTDVETDKKGRIINAAIEEFGKNGFEKASTNNIVENAGVSKGLLYHYFKGKEDLYDYLIDFVFKLVANEINKDVDLKNGDIFERFSQIAVTKMKVQNEYPHIFEIIPKFYEDKTIEDIKNIFEKDSPNMYTRIYEENIDYSLFKENIDIKKSLKIITWTSEKISEEALVQIKKENKTIDINNYKKEFDEYMIFLKERFYK